MASSLDFGAFTGPEKQQLLAAAKSELLRRTGMGSVTSSTSSAQSFMMSKMSEDALIKLINGLTADLGYQQPEVRVRPIFSRAGAGATFVPGN